MATFLFVSDARMWSTDLYKDRNATLLHSGAFIRLSREDANVYVTFKSDKRWKPATELGHTHHTCNTNSHMEILYTHTHTHTHFR